MINSIRFGRATGAIPVIEKGPQLALSTRPTATGANGINIAGPIMVSRRRINDGANALYDITCIRDEQRLSCPQP